MRADVAVVGGGVIGCAVAWSLAREGVGVVLVERDRIGAHASRASAGMLAPITESVGRRDEAAALGLQSLELYPGWVEEIAELSGIEPQLTLSGVLRAAAAGEGSSLRRVAEAQHGSSWLQPDEARKREPRLSPTIEGALWSPREGHVEPLLLTRALAAAAARRGAALALGEPAVGLLTDGERVVGVRTASRSLAAGDVVLCTGAWTRMAGEWAGLAVPVEPVRGQMLALEGLQPPLESIVWGGDVYLVPRRTGSVGVGATVEHVGFDARTTAGALADLLSAAFGLLPALEAASFQEAWAGLRPGTPDGFPFVGRVPGREGLWIAAGHYRSGILLAPLTGERIAAQLAHGEPTTTGDPLDPAREV